ncbi:hypothetical protein [Myxococcus sp. RHSTA-1-4]|uniref:hypothetical protein n=1 Tax=Myxococcus sp. RHSTA-1-4 TaxID=2874601 RepID=UPI001CBDDD2B|nr:hypothetical protein [Myxococcus sp. RHSTA-1-4]MBZ4423341.1 hypothetical protein [Myxococcus sp. RHSTA-1-4]
MSAVPRRGRSLAAMLLALVAAWELTGCCCCGGTFPLEEQAAPAPAQEEAPRAVLPRLWPPPEMPEPPRVKPPKRASASQRAPTDGLPTVKENIAAAPSWVPEMSAAAPQLADPVGLFTEASRPVKEKEMPPGVVLCQVVVVNERLDLLAAPDLLVSMRLGSHPQVTVRGREESNVMYLSMPGVQLREGDEARLRIMDRDVFTNESVGTMKARYAGAFPLLAASRPVQMSCGVLLPGQVKAHVPRYLDAAERQLGALERTRPRALEDHWGYPTWEVFQARAALGHVAALVGWADRRMQPLLERFDAFESRWLEEAEASVRKKAEARPKAGEWVPVLQGRQEARVIAARCGGTPVNGRASVTGACRVEVELKQGKGAPLRVDPADPESDTLPAAVLVRSNGLTEAMALGSLWFNERRRTQVTVKPGEKVRVVWEVQRSGASPAPALLWLRAPDGDVLLRLD